MNTTEIEKLIVSYKAHLKNDRLKDELYKWQLLAKFKGRPRLDAPDFSAEIKSIDYSNLLYYNALSVTKELADRSSEGYKACLEGLFNENEPLKERLKVFDEDTLSILRQFNDTLDNDHDERTSSTFLTFHNPEKYTFYKHSYYRKYCDLIEVVSRKKGEKYVHYLELVDDLIENYIKKDEELIELFQEIISSDDCYKDPNFKILAQDILYQMLDNQVTVERNYWRIGTTDDLNNSYWNFMRDNTKICIGWSEIGDLNNASIIDKESVKNLLDKTGFYIEKKNVQSRKAGEIYDFYANAKNGDIVLAQKGETVLGIGIIKDDYQFEESDNFSHQRVVEWQIENPSFTNKVGNQTTFYKLKKSETGLIFQIESTLNPIKMPNDFINLLRKIGRENAHIYFVYASQLIDSLNISSGDVRVTYTTRDFKRLNIIVGQRYCFNYATDIKQNWGCIQLNETEPTESISQVMFRGNPKAYYVDCVDFKDVKIRFIEAIQASKIELERATKSSFRTNSSTIFEKAIFDEEFRKQIFAVAFDNADIEIELIKQMNNITNQPLNQILYGPPGTGKTYSTIELAYRAIKGDSAFEQDGYSVAKQWFKEELDKTDSEDRQLDFITFHQNYSYEDFIMGIKPNINKSDGLSFNRHEGIFYKICQRALRNLKQSSEEFVNTNSSQEDVEDISTSPASEEFANVKPSFEQVFAELIRPLSDGQEVVIPMARSNTSFRIYKVEGNNIFFRQMSDNSTKVGLKTVQALYEGHRPQGEQGYNVYYNPLNERLQEIANTIQFNPDSSLKTENLNKRHQDITNINPKKNTYPFQKNYVIIIDEINRANISRVFGELITLIEEDKRWGNDHAMEVRLPDGYTPFTVPKNLYIIGTMNTADKSIALLDIALRRRFEFTALYPDSSKVNSKYRSFFEVLNEQIIAKKGIDFTIGHSYFMSKNGEELNFIKTMNKKVIPLLNEYFYNAKSNKVVAELVKDAIAKAGLSNTVVQNDFQLLIQ